MRIGCCRRASRPVVVVPALLSIACLSARADSVTYSFFGSAWLQGTSFTYVSPAGFLRFDTGPVVPTTASDVFFCDVNGAFFKNDIGSLATFDFVSEDELVLKTSACTLDFTIARGDSHVAEACPGSSLISGSSIPASGYLLNVFTNFDVVGTGGIGVQPTQTEGGDVPEPASFVLVGLGCLGLGCLHVLGNTNTSAAQGGQR
jgi:hypothetical protein